MHHRLISGILIVSMVWKSYECFPPSARAGLRVLRFTSPMLAAFPAFERRDIYWPMYLFHFSLPVVQYPSPLHGHRWITRPCLAQLTEWPCSSENTPLPSYSNGLSAGCPLALRGSQQKIARGVGGKRRRVAEVSLRWADEKKRVAIVSKGDRDANSEMLCRHRN